MAGGSRRQSPSPARSGIRLGAGHIGSSSQAGSSRRRSPPRIRNAGSSSRAGCSSGGGADIPLLTPPKKYLGVRQRKTGWAAEITDRVNHKRLWIGTYPTARQAARAYDNETRRLHGPTARVNFPEGFPDDDKPELGPVDLRVATPREYREDGKAMELLQAQRSDKAWMETVLVKCPGFVDEQRAELEAIEKKRRRGPPQVVKEEPQVVKEEPSWMRYVVGPPYVDLVSESEEDDEVDWSTLEAECTDDSD